MSGPVLVITLRDPELYTRAQLRHAVLVARALNRGRLVLCTEPEEK